MCTAALFIIAQNRKFIQMPITIRKNKSTLFSWDEILRSHENALQLCTTVWIQITNVKLNQTNLIQY